MAKPNSKKSRSSASGAPLLSLPLEDLPNLPTRRGVDTSASSSEDDDDHGAAFAETGGNVVPGKRKRWTAYIPTFVALSFILLPHFPLFRVLFGYYYLAAKSTFVFVVHLFVIYSLTGVALTCFLLVVVRDPGPVDGIKAQVVEDARMGVGEDSAHVIDEDQGEGDDEMSLGDMLAMSRIAKGHDAGNKQWDGNGERRWCQKCWTAKPERAHHCKECGRCVLKMDHHCPWLGAKCIGHRTYASFVHLLLNITLLCMYSFGLCIPPLKYYLSWNTMINADDWTPYYVLFTALISFLFALMIGSFYGYHVYLISTNQTTLEHLAPFLILRHIPSLPPSASAPSADSPVTPSSASPSSLSPSPNKDPRSPYFFPSPPADRTSFNPVSITATSSGAGTPRLQEHTLNFAQRRTVRNASRKIRMYDLGWRKNWAEVAGGNGTKAASRGWVRVARLVILGGVGKGDGYSFEFNHSAKKRLDMLAVRLAKQATA